MAEANEPDVRSTASGPRRAVRGRRWGWWVALGLALALVVAAAIALPAWLGDATRQPAALIAVGRAHSCVVTPAGGVTCWGANDHGQLGDATTVARPGPVAVAGLSGVVSVASGAGDHTCALTDAGTIWCWGRNEVGQLGDGTTVASSLPVQVSGATDAAGVAVGRTHACALLAGGGVRCWGGNGAGELGDGSSTDSPTPVDVVDLPIAMASVASSGSSTCAVTVRGRVRCWGDNSDGQLGTGETAPTLVPVPARGVAPRVARVSAGDTHSCAITLFRRAVVCWGANDAGQLGDGTTNPSAADVAVAGLDSGVAAVTASQGRTCAIRAGAVLCWGAGMGSAPAEALASGAVEVAVGPTHACARTDAGGVRCWGANGAGQLGDGSTTDSSVPVDVRL